MNGSLASALSFAPTQPIPRKMVSCLAFWPTSHFLRIKPMSPVCFTGVLTQWDGRECVGLCSRCCYMLPLLLLQCPHFLAWPKRTQMQVVTWTHVFWLLCHKSTLSQLLPLVLWALLGVVGLVALFPLQAFHLWVESVWLHEEYTHASWLVDVASVARVSSVLTIWSVPQKGASVISLYSSQWLCQLVQPALNKHHAGKGPQWLTGSWDRVVIYLPVESKVVMIDEDSQTATV